ncbi:MAG: DnaJ domain-containing protein [Chloroflexota bacterium]
MANDPFRTLGLKSGATPVEIKRAYRVLAKANHPDSAGDAALARFLAIQAAYEQLIGGSAMPPTRGRSAASTTQPWRADPERSRGSWTGARGSTAGRGSSTAGQGGNNAGEGGSAGAGSRGSQGSRRGRTTSDGGPASGAGSGAGARAGTGGARRRGTKKATFGSTTYDEAREGHDPTWQGASWYGQSSGEFWTVNPREYADPRKHGPEYLTRAAERAARAAARAEASGGAAPGPAGTFAPGTAPTGEPAARPAREGNDEARAEAEAGAWAAREARAEAAQAADAARVRASEKAAAARGHSYRGSEGRDGTPVEPLDLGLESALASRWGRLERSPYRRLILALLAWPPIGIAVASLIGQATGCAAFSATCTTTASLYPWLAQAAVILALLLLPGAARLLVGGTVAVFVLAFPVAAILIRRDGPFDPAYGPTQLMGAMAFVWLGGVAFVALLRLRGRRTR